MNPADHAAHLRQTADLMETAARAIEREKELESRLKRASESLNGEVDRRLMMEKRIAELLPVPADGDSRPQFDRLLERLRMANEVNKTWDELVSENDRLRRENQSFQGKLVTNGNYDVCRYNVLNNIYRVLGSDGLPMEIDVLTGVQSHLNRLPKRIEQLLADVTTWRERYDKEVCKNGELVRENETLARNVPPEPPLETEPPVLIGQQWCRIPVGSDTPHGFVYFFYTEAVVVLCNTYQNPDGTLTYVPVRTSDFPEVSAL